MPPDPIPILQPPPTLQISPHILPPLHPLIQPKHPGIPPTLPQPPYRHRKRITNPIHTLPQHQIRIRQLTPVQPLPALARLAPEHALEVSEELGQAVREVVRRLALRLLFLVFVVLLDGDGMVRVVRLVAEAIQRRQRELVETVDRIRVVRGTREAELRRQVQEDVGQLVDDQVAVSEDGRRERGRVRGGAGVLVRDEGREGAHAGFGVRVTGVRVGGAGLFEAEADGFAAAGEGGPVEEFVRGGGGGGRCGFLAFGGGGGCHGGLMGWIQLSWVEQLEAADLGCEIYVVRSLKNGLYHPWLGKWAKEHLWGSRSCSAMLFGSDMSQP